MIIHEIDGTKYACTQCGNIYKWRKSLNKHWKEKHGALKPTPGQNNGTGQLTIQGRPFIGQHVTSHVTQFAVQTTPTTSEPTLLTSLSTKTSPLPGTLPSPANSTYFLSQLRRRTDNPSPDPYALSPEPLSRHMDMTSDLVETPLDLSKSSVTLGVCNSASNENTNANTISSNSTSSNARCYSRYEPYSEQPVTPPSGRPLTSRFPVTPYGEQDAACLYRQLTGSSIRMGNVTSLAGSCSPGSDPVDPKSTSMTSIVGCDLDLAAGGTVIQVPESPSTGALWPTNAVIDRAIARTSPDTDVQLTTSSTEKKMTSRTGQQWPNFNPVTGQGYYLK